MEIGMPYTAKMFPKMLYFRDGQTAIVNGPEDETAYLAKGWSTSPRLPNERQHLITQIEYHEAQAQALKEELEALDMTPRPALTIAPPPPPVQEDEFAVAPPPLPAPVAPVAPPVVAGTFRCPMCAVNTPHEHTAPEIIEYAEKLKASAIQAMVETHQVSGAVVEIPVPADAPEPESLVGEEWVSGTPEVPGHWKDAVPSAVENEAPTPACCPECGAKAGRGGVVTMHRGTCSQRIGTKPKEE